MKKRLYFVDILRALAIINMIIYHTLYDLKYVFYLDMPFFSASSWYYYQQYICISFIFLSGFSSNFSKKHFKNILKLSLASLIITIVTSLISSDLAIRFGILHMLSFALIFIYFFDKIYKSSNKNIHLLNFLLSLTFFIYLKNFFISKLYGDLYQKIPNLPLSFAYGFPKDDFYSADYFPIIPWLILFVSGYFFGKYYFLSDNLKKFDRFLKNKFEEHTKFLIYISNHSFIIYILHQVVIYALLYIIFNF